jgi:hypothetical protein
LHWQYLTRNATWQDLPLRSATAENNAAPADEVRLDHKQCAQLMNTSEPDNVLFQLRRSSSNLVDCHTPACAHEIVRYWLDCANHAQMESAPERFNLCEMGLTYLHLKNSPSVTAWLAEASQPHTFNALYARWVESARN